MANSEREGKARVPLRVGSDHLQFRVILLRHRIGVAGVARRARGTRIPQKIRYLMQVRGYVD